MNQIDIEGIRAREQSATPGPWCISEKGNTVKSLSIDGICHGMSPKQTDAEFIAHARQDIPALLDEVEHQQAELQHAGEVLQALKDTIQNLEAGHKRLQNAQNQLSSFEQTLSAKLLAENERLQALLDSAVEDMLKVLLSQIEKEKAIISNEHGKDYAHLNFADGRRHTLMRVEAWAKTQIKEWRGFSEKGV